jgi:hypothetical protein
VLWVWLVRRRDKKGRKEDEAGKASRWNTLRYESWTGIRTERAATRLHKQKHAIASL